MITCEELLNFSGGIGNYLLGEAIERSALVRSAPICCDIIRFYIEAGYIGQTIEPCCNGRQLHRQSLQSHGVSSRLLLLRQVHGRARQRYKELPGLRLTKYEMFSLFLLVFSAPDYNVQPSR
jgi:hypothetical protein